MQLGNWAIQTRRVVGCNMILITESYVNIFLVMLDSPCFQPNNVTRQTYFLIIHVY